MLKSKWRVQLGSTKTAKGTLTKPLGTVNGGRFLDGVRDWLPILKQLEPSSNELTMRSVGKHLVLRDLFNVGQLAPFGVQEANLWATRPAERSLLCKVVMSSKIQVAEDFAQAISDASVPLAVPGLKRSRLHLGELADEFTPEGVSANIAKVDMALSNTSLSGSSSSAGPMATMRSMAKAVESGVLTHASATRQLVDWSKGQTLESKSRHLSSLRSGLKAWHAFATTVLGYPEYQSFPPRNVEDVVAYRGMFRCAGTAANYIGHLRWLCKIEGYNLEWDGPMLQVALKGVAKAQLKEVSGQLKVKFLLNWDMISKVVSLLDLSPLTEPISVLLLLGWAFLGRMQSEVFPLERGQANESINLPPGRHSALFVSKDGSITIRWRRRKHRPNGSLLCRGCTCRELGCVGVGPSQVCMAHRVQQYLQRHHFKIGEALFPRFKPQATLSVLIKSLDNMRVVGASGMTWKSVRAGRATAMAARGCTLAAILEAGEWRSTAFLNYVDANVADQAEVLRSTLQGELDGDSDEE